MQQIIVDGIEYHPNPMQKEPQHQTPPRGHVSALHIRTAMSLPDSLKLLLWAVEHNASPREMRCYSNACEGKDLTE